MIKDVNPPARLKSYVQWFVESDAVTSLADRLVKVIAAREQILYRAIVCAHTKDHWDRFIDRQIVQPPVPNAERSERRHRQRHVVRKFRAQILQQRAVEGALRNGCVKIDLNRRHLRRLQR